MEDFLREQGVVQSSEVELEHASDGVHVVVVLVSCQRVLPYIQQRQRAGEGLLSLTDFILKHADDSCFTSFKRILDVVDFHLGAGHPEDPLVLQT